MNPETPLHHEPAMPIRNRCHLSEGFTLVEVLLAVAILGFGLGVLLSSLSTCLAAFRVSARFQEAQWVLGMGEALYPLQPTDDVIRDLTVDADRGVHDGYVFERIVEDADEDADDGLFIVRTRVSWGQGGPGAYEEIIRYVWQKEAP